MLHTAFRLVALVFACPTLAHGQATLPLAEEAEWQQVREHCARLVQTLDALKAPLPGPTADALRSLLKDGTKSPNAAVEEVQKLLDAHCLIGISINPESRVKAARGPAAATLRQGRETVLLIKVNNQAGVTHPLAVVGAQLRAAGQVDGGWLEASVQPDRPRDKKLSGQKLEYVLLRLTAHEAGKREATLKFDVGQGTQDLGFRAEVPILFTVLPEKR